MIRLANYFQVSTDYILGRTNVCSRSVTIQSICQFTGLNGKIVSRLHAESQEPLASLCSILNILMSTDAFSRLIMRINIILQIQSMAAKEANKEENVFNVKNGANQASYMEIMNSRDVKPGQAFEGCGTIEENEWKAIKEFQSVLFEIEGIDNDHTRSSTLEEMDDDLKKEILSYHNKDITALRKMHLWHAGMSIVLDKYKLGHRCPEFFSIVSQKIRESAIPEDISRQPVLRALYNITVDSLCREWVCNALNERGDESYTMTRRELIEFITEVLKDRPTVSETMSEWKRIVRRMKRQKTSSWYGFTIDSSAR